jgi:hypothetical protein
MYQTGAIINVFCVSKYSLFQTYVLVAKITVFMRWTHFYIKPFSISQQNVTFYCCFLYDVREFDIYFKMKASERKHFIPF